MTDRAAFQATYSDWRLIKGRKVVQIVFELPLEKASLAYESLGGMPNPASEVWCAIARMNLKEVMPDTAHDNTGPHNAVPRSQDEIPSKAGGAQRRPFTSLPLTQQSAILCADPVFRSFLNEEYGCDCHDDESTAAALRKRCNVTSRADIKPGTMAASLFIQIREQFIAWKLVAA